MTNLAVLCFCPRNFEDPNFELRMKNTGALAPAVSRHSYFLNSKFGSSKFRGLARPLPRVDHYRRAGLADELLLDAAEVVAGVDDERVGAGVVDVADELALDVAADERLLHGRAAEGRLVEFGELRLGRADVGVAANHHQVDLAPFAAGNLRRQLRRRHRRLLQMHRHDEAPQPAPRLRAVADGQDGHGRIGEDAHRRRADEEMRDGVPRGRGDDDEGGLLLTYGAADLRAGVRGLAHDLR